MIKRIILYFLLVLPINVVADTFTIDITGVSVNQGSLYIGLFNSKTNFPDESKTFQRKIMLSSTKEVRTTFEVPKGNYAIAVYQDHNNNKHLDTNFFGIPKESYGFSGKQVFGKPDYEDAKIHIEDKKTISIHLK